MSFLAQVFDLTNWTNIVSLGCVVVGGYGVVHSYIAPHLSRTVVEIGCLATGAHLGITDILFNTSPQASYLLALVGNAMVPLSVSSMIQHYNIKVTHKVSFLGLAVFWGWQSFRHQSSLTGLGATISYGLALACLFEELLQGKVSDSEINTLIWHGVATTFLTSYNLLAIAGLAQHPVFLPLEYPIKILGTFVYYGTILSLTREDFSPSNFTAFNFYGATSLIVTFYYGSVYNVVYLKMGSQITFLFYAINKFFESNFKYWEFLLFGLGCSGMAIPYLANRYPSLFTNMMPRYPNCILDSSFWTNPSS